MEVTRLNIRCHDCYVPLARITLAMADEVYCPTCGAGADYEQVVKDGRLVRGLISQEKLIALRRKLGISRK